jgi:hypothetical protein
LATGLAANVRPGSDRRTSPGEHPANEINAAPAEMMARVAAIGIPLVRFATILPTWYLFSRTEKIQSNQSFPTSRFSASLLLHDHW